MPNFDNRLYNHGYNFDMHSYELSNKDIIPEKHEDYNSNDFYSMKYSNDLNTKPSCQVFCENEVLNRQNCNCLECKYKMDEQFVRDNSKNSNACQFSTSDYCLSEKTPSECNCGKRTCEKVNSDSRRKEYQTSRTVAETVYSTDTVKVVPFSTERLKSTRHRSKNVILSILDNGDVCVEFLRNKSKLKEMVVEVCRITKNGLKVSLGVFYDNLK